MTTEFNLSEWVTYIQERKASFVRDNAVKEFIRLGNEIILMDISNCEKSDRFKLLAGDKLKGDKEK